MNKTKVTLNDGSHAEGYVVSLRGTTWVHLDGETFAIESSGRKKRGGAAGGTGNPGDVLAPMPGKIIKIMAKEGEAATQGQVLLVMEAMKMEYTLKAQADGKVASVNCKVGDQVTLGQKLVHLDV